MRNIFILCAVGAVFTATGQPAQVSLRAFCPTKAGQDKSVCFAYAPVYTALSIAHNIANGVSDEGDSRFESYSYGFVASRIKQGKGFFVRLVDHCGRGGTVELSLAVLANEGTVPYTEFQEECECSKVSGASSDAAKYKIRNWSMLGDVNTPAAIHIAAIKKTLAERKPVIIALYSPGFFGKTGDDVVQFPPLGQRDSTAIANHAICIVGYDDARGMFLVKNNYTGWRDHGFAYVKYTDLIVLVRNSYTLDL